MRVSQYPTLALLSALVALGGCGVAERLSKQAENSWSRDLLRHPDEWVLTADGGNALNPDAEGQPLSVVLRVYQLVSLDRFAQASRDELWHAAPAVLGPTLLGSEELTVKPGRGQVEQWPLAPGARYVGLAGFFRSASGHRWKVAYDLQVLRTTGIWRPGNSVRVLLEHNQILPTRGSDVLNQNVEGAAP